MIAVIIPTLGRAHRLAKIVANVAEATVSEHRVHFVVEADDVDSNVAVLALGLMPFINGRAPSYSGAINTAYEYTDEPYLFTGADDLRFEHGWDLEALKLMDGWVQVVGTNDMLNPYVLAGTHSTHSLVARRYLDDIGGCVDEGPGSFLHEGYGHNYCDTEFIATAKARSRFRPCLTSVVQHLHESAGHMPQDSTHDKANATYAADGELYEERSVLWHSLSR